MTHDDLEREFGKYGQHKEVRMAPKSPGFAFVEFENMSYVDEAMREMNGAIVNGVLLRVERARQKSSAPGYGYDYASTTVMANPYAAPPAYTPALPAAAFWKSLYGTTYAAPASGFAERAPGYTAPPRGRSR
nr:serine/arginine-rich splicing factor 3-like [Rhipicephalus microplus]